MKFNKMVLCKHVISGQKERKKKKGNTRQRLRSAIFWWFPETRKTMKNSLFGG